MAEYKPIAPHPNFSEIEKEVLSFWEKERIFQKSLEQTKESKPFTFYDGPPFATGLPHYGHILASTIKDLVPRYQTMRGRYVRRRWGWDCHGLPIEELVERKLGISGKKEIEKIGIQKFNEMCRSLVLQYVEEWGKMVRRIARWVEFENSYKTMDTSYMESVWWAFKQVWKKGLVYEGRKVLLYCPRCETPVSNFEVAMDQSYRDVEETAVTVKFKVKGEENTYFLAWTTTPWTLPGNVALAVGKDIDYAMVRHGDAQLIVALDRVPAIFGDSSQLLKTIKGNELVELSYEPLFNVPAVSSDKSYKVYTADFVSTSEGTGIVHTAVVYGEEDYALGQKEGLPVVPLLDEKGVFNEQAPELVRGKYFKDADKAIIKDLESRGLLFEKKNHTHSYPFCWRCGTELFYNAIPAWFVNVQKVKKDLLRSNERQMHWYPAHLKHGRYQKSVEAAPDWNISRNRYWGNPIPVWRCAQCDHRMVVGSLEELNEHRPDIPTTFIFVRHGESVSNVEQFVSSIPETRENPLTAKGREQVERAARKLPKEIDIAYVSPLLRGRQTVEILKEYVRIGRVQTSDALREVDLGEFNGESIAEYHHFYHFLKERLFKAPRGGENGAEVQARVWQFLKEKSAEHQGKTILVVTHRLPMAIGEALLSGITSDDFRFWDTERSPGNATVARLPFPNFPFNDKGEADLHRPYIDEIVLKCEKCGETSRRITEIFDSWTEAASMPFAEYHYPFENKDKFESRFPGQFVAEYIPQTRAWFYTMHVVSQVLFGRAPVEHLVTTGTILAEDGSKMSKSKQNFPDPWQVIEKYGVDALRFYLMNSPVMRAEDLNFSERDLQSINRKIIRILWNTYNYFVTYANEAGWQFDPKGAPKEREGMGVLDQWIEARLKNLIAAAAESLDGYDTVRYTREVETFIGDLSTWYVRRSRGRTEPAFFLTLYRMLFHLAQVMAPVTPYLPEYIYQNLRHETFVSSVHLSGWPELGDLSKDEKLMLEKMAKVRELASLALARRAAAGMKIRQKLGTLSLNLIDREALAEFTGILADEVNVERIVGDAAVPEGTVVLDTELSPALLREGMARELVRGANDLRKETKLTPRDRIRLYYSVTNPAGDREEMSEFDEMLRKETRADTVESLQGHGGDSPDEDLTWGYREWEDRDWKLWVGIRKV
jgi:isoleucyl-tRNA synthetase